jgi:hypothetical protein
MQDNMIIMEVMEMEFQRYQHSFTHPLT